jgi:hypothetical protein
LDFKEALTHFPETFIKFAGHEQVPFTGIKGKTQMVFLSG